MPEPKNPLAVTGRTVAANVRRLRGQLGYAELSRRLAAVGRSIPVLGLSAIEKEARRVDADDLAALAVVLGVSPITLLMPDTEHADDPVGVTGSSGLTDAEIVWLWLVAERPLDLRIEHSPGRTAADGKQWKQFILDAQPSWRQWIGAHPAQVALDRLSHWVGLALQPGDGSEMGWTDPHRYKSMLAGAVREQIAELQRLADGLDAGDDVRQGWPVPHPDVRRHGDR